MARIRSFKPEFFSSPTVARLDYATRLFFMALWSFADDYGRGPANPKELIGFAFPWDDDLGSADARRMLGGLSAESLVTLYTVGERPYYQVNSWDEHQKIDKRSQPRWPGPEDDDARTQTTADLQEHEGSEDPVESPPSPRRDSSEHSALEQGNRGTGEQDQDHGADGAFPTRIADATPYANRVAKWAEANGKHPPEATHRSDRYAWVLDLVAANALTEGQTIRLSAAVVSDYVTAITGEPPAEQARDQIRFLVSSNGAKTTLRVIATAIEKGAGLDPEYVGKPRALVSYAAGILQRERREHDRLAV